MEDVTRAAERRATEAGFSLVEVLIASTLLLIIMLGLVPIFMQSVLNNASGNESSMVSNIAKTTAEEFYSLEYEHPTLVVESGSEKVINQHSTSGRIWLDGSTPSDGQDFEREVTLRQYQLFDLEDDGKLNQPFAAPAGTGGTVNLFPVHFREIEIEATGRQIATGGVLSSVLNKNVTVRVLRGF